MTTAPGLRTLQEYNAIACCVTRYYHFEQPWNQNGDTILF
jgi:hypothetical protein